MSTSRVICCVVALWMTGCPRSEPRPAESDGGAAQVDTGPPLPAGTALHDGPELRYGDDVFRVGARVRLRKRAGSIPPNAPYNTSKTLLAVGPGQVGAVTRLLVLTREGVGHGNPALEVRWAKQRWPEFRGPMDRPDGGNELGPGHLLDEFTTSTLHPSYAEPLPEED